MRRVKTRQDAQELFEYLTGKTISLVGNAQSLLEREYGEMIDASDIVMRINSGYPRHYKSQGIKTNVVWMGNRFISDKVLPDYLRVSEDFYYVLQNGRTRFEIESCLIKGDLYNWQDVWKLHKPMMRKKPSQGFMIVYILYKEIECKLNLFGFDFQKTETQVPRSDLYIRRTESPHDFETEEFFVRKMLKERHWTIHE